MSYELTIEISEEEMEEIYSKYVDPLLLGYEEFADLFCQKSEMMAVWKFNWNFTAEMVVWLEEHIYPVITVLSKMSWGEALIHPDPEVRKIVQVLSNHRNAEGYFK